MAGNEVVLQMEEQWRVVSDQFGEPDDMGALEDLKSKIDLLVNEGEFESPLPSSEMPQCPMVPKRSRPDVRGAEDYYAPKLNSLGPYHYGNPDFKDGETLKLKLAVIYIVKWEATTVDIVYRRIRQSIRELRGCYDAESTKKYNDGELTKMMLVDGCALLCYILYVCLGYGRQFINIRYQDISLLHQDALLLENQLPYQLLLMLMNMGDIGLDNDFWMAMFQEFCGINDESIFLEFIGIYPKRKPQSPNNESRPCPHLLDLFRRNFLGDERSSSPTHLENINLEGPWRLGRASVRDVKEVMASFRNVKELMDAGIRIKRSPTRDISFRSNGITACLRIPPITIDKSTKTLFFNLIAYEMTLAVDHHDFISYLRFLDSLIDHADDVKELQCAGVLQNNLGTHEEVAEFFNTVSADLESNFLAYKDVRVKIRNHLKSHYNSRLKRWMTQCLDTHFGSPWTIIAWVGAALALFFTAVQTYFSAFRR